MVCFFINGNAFTQTTSYTSKEKEIKLNKFFDYCYSNNLFNGSVLIKQQGKVLFNKSYGFENPSKKIKKIDENTPFMLASLSKQFTAYIIVELASTKKLKYNDYVHQYLADFPYQNITIRQLLNHTSGLVDYTYIVNPKRNEFLKAFIEKKEILDNNTIYRFFTAKKPPLQFDPGSSFNYSNTGYVILSLIAEKIEDKSFAEIAENLFTKKLKLKNTGVLKPMSQNKIVNAFKRTILDNKYVDNNIPPFFYVNGDGGMYSSTKDISIWLDNLIAFSSNQEDHFKEMIKTPYINEEKLPYGFGWFIKSLPFNGHTALTHSGSFTGYKSSAFVDFKDNTYSIVLSNNSHNINQEINSAIVRILYGQEYKLPQIPVYYELGNLIMEKDISEVKLEYQRLKNNKNYNCSENMINKLGYSLIEKNEVDKAIDIFKWNTELNPNSSNVYDSLGEAFLLKGDKAKALSNYKKSVNLDEGNKNAVKIISQLENQK